MKTNISTWATLLTVSGILLTAPLTVTAAVKVVNGVAEPPESGQTYEAVSGSSALYVYNPGASYSGANITLSTSISGGGNSRFAVYVNNQAALSLSGGAITVSGSVNYMTGVYINNASSGTLNDVVIQSSGSLISYGVNAESSSSLSITGGAITVSGSRNHGVVASSSSALILNNVAVRSDYFGAQATSGATLSITDGSITTTGSDSHGVYVTRASGTLNNVNVSTFAGKSRGLYALNSGTLFITGGTIATTGDDEAHGVQAGRNSFATLDNVDIQTSGSFSTGVSIYYSSTMTVSGGSITTSGEGADGVRLDGESGNRMTLNNVSVLANGMDAHGVLMNTDSAASGDATDVLTVSGGSVSAAQGSALKVDDVSGGAVDYNIQIAGGAELSGTAALVVTGTGTRVTVAVEGNSTLNGGIMASGSTNTTVSVNDSALTGDLVASNDAALTVTLDNSAMTGVSTVNDTAATHLTLNNSVWNMTGSSSLTTLNNSGSIVIANALGEDLSVSGTFVQDADGTLDLTISGSGPIVTAGTASIGGTLKVGGFSGTAAAKASEIVAKNFTVIHSASGISGDFSIVDFGSAASTVDYITLAAGLTNSNRDYALNYGLSWFAASSTSHGNFTISSGTSFEIDITLSDTNAGAGAGGWDGKTLTKLGDGLLIVSSSNNFTGGATVDSGTLRLSNLAGAGSGTVNVAQTILSVLDLSGSGEYKNDTTGAGTVIVSGSGVNISGTNTTFVGMWDVTGSGTMTSQNNLGVSGSTAVNIAHNGALSLILGSGDYHFDQPLTGSGFLLIQNAGNISLVPSVPLVAYVPSFTGTVELQHNTLALSADNALPLTLATLVTSTNNLVVVDSDPSATARNLGALSFSGGTVRFEGYDPHATRADTIIALSGTLSLSGGGTVEVVMPNPSQIPDGSKFTHIPLLQQDDGLALTLLISASGGVTSSPATLTLRDDSCNIISDSYTLNLSHDGVTTDAIGTYDYLLSTSAANDGLYVAFGLKQVDIQAGRTLILDQDVTVPAEGDDFTATLIGSGNLQINATNAITLNGTGNAYSGTTIVNTGTLLVGINEQMFASSTAFVINSGAAFDTNGTDQLVNNLSGSGLATFTNNTLTVNNSSSTSFSGTLCGSKLVKDGGAQLNANDAVANLTQVQIDNGSLLLGANATVSASGQPAVLANGGTATFNNSALSTSGSVLILAKDNAPATVNLNNMSVSVTGNFVEANNGALTVTLNDSTATGKTAVVGGGALNLGLNNSVWNLTGKSKLTTLTSSGGTITIDNVQGEDLVVTSGITGQTALNLTLSDSVKGNQEIWVVVDETNNMTGERFTLSHEVSYGMYNYNLVNANDGAWLVYTGSSGTIPPVNPPPVNPPTISDEGDTIINTAAAVAGFWFTQLDNLHKRMGELRYNKPANADALDNIWVRAYGQQINANTGITSVKGFFETQYGVDLGTDYLWKLDAANQLYTGVFAGYGGADRDFHTNYSGNTNSGYGGLYATWLNNSGWYADVVAKGQYFRNDFSGADRGDYDSVGLGFSVELGRQFEFKDGWFVEPSAQFSYLHLMNDNYTTRDGLHVDLTDADVLHIYGGARFGRNIKLTNSGMLQPYIKAGGLGQISSGNKLTVSGDHWRPNLDGARAVVGAGLIWQLDANSQLHLDYEASFGEKYDKPWGVNFGYRYQF